MIQAVLFDKNIWNLDLTKSYLNNHNFYPIKPVHETKNYYRYRLKVPNKNANYITKKLKNGVALIIEMN